MLPDELEVTNDLFSKSIHVNRMERRYTSCEQCAPFAVGEYDGIIYIMTEMQTILIHTR